MLKVRDWTTRKSRDFNEEYPKLRFLSDPDFCDPSVLCVSTLRRNNLYVLRLSHLIRVVCLPLFPGVSLAVLPPPSLPPRIFSHPNVLPMLGACQSPPAPHPIIITHWMPYGSLYNVLHEGTSEYFDSEDGLLSLAAELKVCLSGLTSVSRPPVRLCRGPDAGREVCPGHCLWNGLPTHAWTNDPSSLSQQQECDGENQNSS